MAAATTQSQMTTDDVTVVTDNRTGTVPVAGSPQVPTTTAIVPAPPTAMVPAVPRQPADQFGRQAHRQQRS